MSSTPSPPSPTWPSSLHDKGLHHHRRARGQGSAGIGEQVVQIMPELKEKFFEYCQNLEFNSDIDPQSVDKIPVVLINHWNSFRQISEVDPDETCSNLDVSLSYCNIPADGQKTYIFTMNVDFGDDDGKHKALRTVEATVTVLGSGENLKTEITVRGLEPTSAKGTTAFTPKNIDDDLSRIPVAKEKEQKEGREQTEGRRSGKSIE